MRILFLAILLSLICNTASAEYFIRDEVFCDDKKIACIRGRMKYNAWEKYLELNGRLTKSCPPGVITIYLKGIAENKEEFFATFTLKIRGNYTEIVYAKKGNYYWRSMDIDWKLTSLTFEPSKEKR